MSTSEGGGDWVESYLWANERVGEERRLRLLEAVADPRSFRLLEQAGVGEGWRCAELGAGAGSVAGWLWARVGTAGRVLALDLDTRFLTDVGSRPNVDVVEGDLAKVDLPGGGFDLIHTRNVLVHLPERDAILERLIAALRPGGVLIVEEGDSYPLAGTTSSIFARVIAPLASRWRWARHLPTRLAAMADVAHTSVFVEADMIQGGTALAQFWAATIRAATETIIKPSTGPAATPAAVSMSDIDRVLALLEQESFWTPLMAVVCVSATRGSSES